jgi:hypothetical protein
MLIAARSFQDFACYLRDRKSVSEVLLCFAKLQWLESNVISPAMRLTSDSQIFSAVSMMLEASLMQRHASSN